MSPNQPQPPAPVAPLARPVPQRMALALILLAALISAGAMGLALWRHEHRLGFNDSDVWALVPNASVHSWGFNLSPLLVERDDLTVLPFGPRKDDISALSHPDTIDHRLGEHLPQDGEHIVGVVIGGQARAYPLGLLLMHEVINDTLGGEALCVTAQRWAGTIAAYSRDVGGETLEFGVSGLLYKMDLLVFDRRRDPREQSLWSPLLLQPISGPAAERGLRLQPIDCAVEPWGVWRQLHPETTLMTRQTQFPMEYQPALFFSPTSARPDSAAAKNTSTRRPDLDAADPLVVVIGPRSMRGYPYRDVPAEGALVDQLDGRRFALRRSTTKNSGITLESLVPAAAGTSPLTRAYVRWSHWEAINGPLD